MAMRHLTRAWPSLRYAASEAWAGHAGSAGNLASEMSQVTRLLSSTPAALARVRRTRTELMPSHTTVITPEGEQKHAIEPYTNPTLDVPAIANVVQHSALIVTRPIEWGTVLLGFEQANRYSIYDEQGVLVGHLMEEEGGFGRAIGRQLLRTRRPFTATVLNAEGTEVLFRMRRPFYFINSSMYIEDGSGNVVGEVQQRWHLWRRNYDLYIDLGLLSLYPDRHQFSAIEGALLAWDFELKDEEGKTLALIDRNFQGFGKELFTDAGRYAIHFGSHPMEAAKQLSTAIHAQHPDQPAPPVTALARYRTGVEVIPTSTGNQLVVHRPLILPERMVALAAAISIDYDFFSRHSSGGGGLLSPFIVPPVIPYPVETGAETAGESAPAEVEPEGAAPTSAPEHQPDSSSPVDEPLERNLGDDSFWGGQDASQHEEGEDSDGGWLSGLSGLLGGDEDEDGW